MKVVHKAALAFVVISFGVTTTLALHVVAKPYVVRMRFDPATSAMRIDQLNLLGRPFTTSVQMGDVRAASRPWATIEIISRPSRRFFVESDPDAYEDQEFRETLLRRVNAAAGIGGKREETGQ